MTKVRLRLLLLVIVFGWSVSSQSYPHLLAQTAATSDDPLFFLYRDTIWRWSPANEADRIGQPFPKLINLWLAPDGTRLLIKTISEHVKTLVDQECPCGGTVPDGREFWLLDLASGKRTRITPDYENYPSLSEVPVLSDPLWSPDGTRIAWTQGLEYSDLMIYDLATGATTIPQTGIPGQTRVSSVATLTRWTPAGIWVKRVQFQDDLHDLPGGYTIYNPAGGIAAEIPPYIELAGLPDVKMFAGTPDYETFNNFSVNAGGVDTLITHSLTGWQSLDLATGTSQPLTAGTVMLASAAAPATSLRIAPVSFSADSETMEVGAYHHVIYTPEGTQLADLSESFPLLTLYGSAVVTERDGQLMRLLFADGSTRVFELPWEPDRIITTPTRYQLESSETPLLVGTYCEGSDLPFRFSILPADLDSDPGGHVLGTEPNNLRETPGRDSAVIGELKGGESFDVLAGPMCTGGIAWWKVEGWNGQTGWTAEGADGEYYLAPGCSVDYCNAEG